MILQKCFFFCVTLIALIVFAGCGSKLEGVYVANHKDGYDTLKIYPDKKFVRIYYDPNYKLNSRVFKDKGTWSIGSDGDIYFRDWFARCEAIENTEKKESYIYGAVIKKSFFSDEVKLIIDIDRNYYYQKQK